jgi:hypothetical protein
MTLPRFFLLCSRAMSGANQQQQDLFAVFYLMDLPFIFGVQLFDLSK